ncbi:hypothetical protein NXZ75_13810 [Lysinibacillus sphaericus]|uniref:hypothetical protein n=1 Tax=Lysinibacillus sphaericus TaxID=1421 RepID=UPI002162638B|nr:hypothetical protein [Lysinibacillus sphaericus]MCS1383278.1 hypothetical protein [Lysinibacillus sphaericus]
MFKQKEYAFNLHSGIYQFQVPFYLATLVPGEDGIVPVSYCDVEMHIGSKNLDDDTIATILISTKKEYQSPTIFIEQVISVIYDNYLPIAIIGDNAHKFIRWVQRENYPQEIFSELEVKYSSKGKIVGVAFGGKLKDNDFILQNHKLPKY